MKEEISVIIPTRGPVNRVLKTLESILKAQNSHFLEIIVVNDGGGEEISQAIKRYRNFNHNISEIFNSHTLGSYFARNQGIKKSKCPWLLFADDSLRLPLNWLNIFKVKAKYGDIVCSNILVENNEEKSLAKTYFETYGFQQERKIKEGRIALTTFLFVRKFVFQKIGLFCSLLYSGGDVEFSHRAYAYGFRLIFIKELKVPHESLGWIQQFKRMTRFVSIRHLMAFYFPYRYGHWKLSPFDLLKTIKYLLNNIIHYRQTYFYQNSNVGFWKHLLGQVIYFSLYLCSQILVLMFPKKAFNW